MTILTANQEKALCRFALSLVGLAGALWLLKNVDSLNVVYYFVTLIFALWSGSNVVELIIARNTLKNTSDLSARKIYLYTLASLLVTMLGLVLLARNTMDALTTIG